MNAVPLELAEARDAPARPRSHILSALIRSYLLPSWLFGTLENSLVFHEHKQLVLRAYVNEMNGYSPANNCLTAPKPIGEVESASQADFFRMLDAKIAHGADLESENET
ncbi:hypothetical protein NECAME_00617 [Necator americanus]|uniref:Uncharacterized protein n=1 Tax=Necator americanus TaxID=51031 RepID=W2T1U3_NECAM|nr:hypothetical protein NECAME_00617 [Necator americanus]ETN75206.1 hypothetical protein NECAME_00617 [Necator americanus]